MLFRTGLLAAVVSLGMATAAYSAPITGKIYLGGYVEAVNSPGLGMATGLNFTAGPANPSASNYGLLYSYGGGSGSFSGLACSSSTIGTCGTIRKIASFATEGPTTSFLTLSTGLATQISFDLTSITNVSHSSDPGGGSVTFTAKGIINFTGLDSTEGAFILTAGGSGIVSFVATVVASENPVPEPASIAILGGSLAALSLSSRRKTI